MRRTSITLDKETVAEALAAKAQELTSQVTDDWSAHAKVRYGEAIVTFTEPEPQSESQDESDD